MMVVPHSSTDGHHDYHVHMHSYMRLCDGVLAPDCCTDAV